MFSNNSSNDPQRAYPNGGPGRRIAQSNENDDGNIILPAAESTEAPPAPPPTVAVTTMQAETCDGDNAPVPPAPIAAAYDKMEEAIKESIQNTPSDDFALLHPTQIAAAHEEMNDETHGAQKKPEVIYEDEEALMPAASVAATSHEEDVEPFTVPTAPTESRMSRATNQMENPPNSGQHQAAVATMPRPQLILPIYDSRKPSAPPLEATLVQGVEATLIVSNNVPDIPIYNAVQFQKELRWCKRHQKSLIFRLVLVSSVALAITATLLASQSNNNASTLPYYLDWIGSRCVNGLLGQPNANLGQPLYESIEECCKPE